MFDLDRFPESKSAKEMLSYVTSGWYDKSYIGKWLYEVMGIEIDMAAGYIESLPEQLFPETATWGLKFHEEKYGLPVREELPAEERRMRIFQKRDLRTPMTPHHMEEYLINAIGIEAHVADCNDPGELGYIPEHPNVFKVLFVNEGTLNTQKIRELIDKIKQSHTSYVIGDWMKVSMEYRGMEQFLLRNVIIQTQMVFFAILIGGIENYNLKTGMSYTGMEIAAQEWIKVSDVTFKTESHAREEIRGAGTENFLRIASQPEQKVAKLKVSLPVDGGKERIDAVVSGVRRNSWRFDGEIMMDGSRYFNSLYEEEDL